MFPATENTHKQRHTVFRRSPNIVTRKSLYVSTVRVTSLRRLGPSTASWSDGIDSIDICFLDFTRSGIIRVGPARAGRWLLCAAHHPFQFNARPATRSRGRRPHYISAGQSPTLTPSLRVDSDSMIPSRSPGESKSARTRTTDSDSESDSARPASASETRTMPRPGNH
jgi:hypothetical protein